MVLCPYVWRLSSFHYRNIPLNGILGFTVIDIISVWCYHRLLSARWAGVFLYVTIHSSLCEGASVDHRKCRKSFILIACSATWMYPHCLLQVYSWIVFIPILISIYPSLHLQNKLLSLIIYLAGFTTSLCLNTPALLRLSRALVRGAQQSLEFVQCFVKLWQCSGEDRCLFWPAFMCGMNDYDRSAAGGLRIISFCSPTSWSPFFILLSKYHHCHCPLQCVFCASFRLFW